MERERAAQEHAAHLARANEALRGCLDTLASVPELDDFLGQVMAVITRHLGAVAATLRVLDLEQNTLTLELLFQDGRVMSPAEAKYPESWRSLSLDEQRGATFLDQPTTVARILDPHSPIPEALRFYLLGLGNGSGISSARLAESEGVGLSSMRDRAGQIGAKLEIQSAVGRGTSVIVTVPTSS